MSFWWNREFGRKYTELEKAIVNNEITNYQRQPPGFLQFFLYPALVLFGLGFLISMFR